MNTKSDLRQQATAVNHTRNLIRLNAKKVGLRQSEVSHLDRQLALAADTLMSLIASAPAGDAA